MRSKIFVGMIIPPIMMLLILIMSGSCWGEEIDPGWDVPVVSEFEKYSDTDPEVVISGSHDGWVWRKEFGSDGAEFMRVQFRFSRCNPDPGWFLRVMDGDGNEVDLIDHARIGSDGVVWTRRIYRDHVAIEFHTASNDTDVGFKVTGFLKKKVTSIEESVRGIPDFEDLPVEDQGINAHMKRVARLAFVRDGQEKYCTGFLLSSDLLITNEHCINDEEGCLSAEIWFDYVKNAGVVRQDRNCTEVVLSAYATDFSLLRLNKPLGVDLADLEYRSIGDKEDGTHLYVIQHPGGEYLQLTRIDCIINGGVTTGRESLEKTDFEHICDTRGGSSGSPVFDTSGMLVGIHHYGFKRSSENFRNRAVKITAVFDEIKGRDRGVYSRLSLKPN